ncbi:MAG TPA: GntR family transcriptional regulator [Kribbella sp.]|nr:GntR family transcriptional regulator [Kribbella sp.]
MALLYERICTHVLEQLRRGALRPGERVPSEMELAAQFGVSRITSKRALEVLREAGLVERVRGKGTFVVRRLPDLTDVTVPLRPPQRREARSVALIVPSMSEAFGLDLLNAIEERCTEYGVHLVVRRTHGRQTDEEKAVDSLVATVDGLIVFPVYGDFYNASLLRQVLDGFPVVLVDRHLSGIPVAAVLTDNVAAARALTTRLLDQGHEHIAFVSPPPVNTSSIEDRLEGFRSAFAGRGRPHELIDLRSTIPGSTTTESVHAEMDVIRAFRDRTPEVTAYVACEYNLARMVDRALGDDRVVACFDSPGDSIGGPPYLHVRQNELEMGHRAVDLLLAQLRGEHVPNLTYVPFELVDAET